MAKQEFDVDDLLAPYDQGRLVPFIGSGMSMPSCVSWKVFVERLETEARQLGAEIGDVDQLGLIPRAHRAVSKIRMHSKEEFAKIVERSLWDSKLVPQKTLTLAEIYWPIVCTTNYDDLYCQAVRHAGRQPPLVVGQSISDCRRILEQMAFPTGEVLWALQGFLRSDYAKVLGDSRSGTSMFDSLRQQLVIGHSEYRAVTHRYPHFRRAFAHLYRTRSLLFFGSGIAEPYFLGLFDEVVELTGQPEHPHYALLPEGSVDPAFLRSQYHILVHTYPCKEDDQHDKKVESFLSALSKRIKSSRSSVSTWGFRTDLPDRLSFIHCKSNFEVVTASLPSPTDVAECEAVAISCGRYGTIDPGEPLLSGVGADAIGYTSQSPKWLDPYVVEWLGLPQAFGIVARELIAEQKPDAHSSQDRRSPLAIATAFRAFLTLAAVRGYETAHIQLLAAGRHRVFPPWVSLAQMARAFGEWKRDGGSTTLRLRVYVVDPGVLALLRAGQLDLTRELEGASLQISVEIVDRKGGRERYFVTAKRNESLACLAQRIGVRGSPIVTSHPSFRLKGIQQEFDAIKKETLEEHVISGSTLAFRFDTPE